MGLPHVVWSLVLDVARRKLMRMHSTNMKLTARAQAMDRVQERAAVAWVRGAAA